MLNLEVFSERLDDLMRDKGLNPASLAEAVKVDRSTISRYLEAKIVPSLNNLTELADFFECSCDFLLGLDEESRSNIFHPCPPFPERLKFLLDHFDINKYKLQKMTKLPESSIYNWQRGQYVPNVDSVVRIAEALDRSFDFVIGRGD